MKINHMYMIPYGHFAKRKSREYSLCKATLLCFYGAYGAKENVIQMFGPDL